MRWGCTTGCFEPIRMNSTCGICRSRDRIHSRRSSSRLRGSPPDRSTSRMTGVRRDVVDGLLQVVLADAALAYRADHAGACAVAAVDGAEIGDQQQHPVRIPVHEPRYRAVESSPSGSSDSPLDFRYSPGTGITVLRRPCAGSVGIKEAGVVRGYAERQGTMVGLDGLPLAIGQAKHPVQIGRVRTRWRFCHRQSFQSRRPACG